MKDENAFFSQQPKKPVKKSKFSRTLFLLFIIFVVVISLFNFVRLGPSVKETELSYSQFLKVVESQRITKVTIRGHIIRGELGPNMPFKTYAPTHPQLIEILLQNGVEIQAAPESSPWLLNVLGGLLPILIFVVIWIYIMRHIRKKTRKSKNS